MRPTRILPAVARPLVLNAFRRPQDSRGLLALGASVLACAASADIATDGSLGPKVELAGPEMTIGAELGQTRGKNLFHSFQRFNIPTDQRATFTGPGQIEHVVSRVTGGDVSNIDGQLRSEVGQADVYLINPAGVVMGPDASVDVPASLHVSTADEMRFSDGSRFSAADPSTSTLTMAAPEAFGFLGGQAGQLELDGSALRVQPQATLSLSGGDLHIAGSAARPASLTAQSGQLQLDAVGEAEASIPVDSPAPDPSADIPHRGQLRLSRVRLDSSGDGGGAIALKAGSAALTDTLVVSENQGPSHAEGGISAEIAGPLEMASSDFFSDAVSSGRSGLSYVRADDLWMSGSLIASDSFRSASTPAGEALAGAAGVQLRLEGSLVMDEGSAVRSFAFAEGPAGPVTVEIGGGLRMTEGTQITSSTLAAGDAAEVRVTARDALLDHGGLDGQITGIFSQANPGSSGKAAPVTLEIAEELRVIRGAQISSSTFAPGDAAPVTVNAGAVHLDNGGLQNQITGIFSQANPDSSGSAAAVTIRVDEALDVLRGAQISSSTFGSGHAEGVIIEAGSAHLDGSGSATANTGIFSQSNPGATGNAGTVTLDIDGLITVLSGAQISSSTFGSGKADAVTIDAESAYLDGRNASNRSTGVFSQSNPGATGDAGSVILHFGSLVEMRNGAQISSNTIGSGNAGSVDLGVEGSLRISNGAEVTSRTLGSGNAGDVGIHAADIQLRRGFISSAAGQTATGKPGRMDIRASSLKMSDESLMVVFSLNPLAPDPAPPSSKSLNPGGLTLNIGTLLLEESGISALSAGPSPAGEVVIQADQFKLTNASVVSTESLQADAGPITIDGGYLWLDDSRITTSAEGVAGNGGDILIAPEQLILEGGFIQANTAAPNARGGDIRIDSAALIASLDAVEIGGLDRQRFVPGSGLNVIQAAAPLGVQGDIRLSSPDFDITATLVPLRTPFQHRSAILDQLCQLADNENTSSLVEEGRGGLPPDAGTTLPGSLGGSRLDQLLRERARPTAATSLN